MFVIRREYCRKRLVTSIDAMLYALEQQTGIETVVAVVPSIGETDCFDFCHQLLNKWGVGKKDKNNGLVILLVTDQRCIQFLYRLRLWKVCFRMQSAKGFKRNI